MGCEKINSAVHPHCSECGACSGRWSLRLDMAIGWLCSVCTKKETIPVGS